VSTKTILDSTFFAVLMDAREHTPTFSRCENHFEHKHGDLLQNEREHLRAHHDHHQHEANGDDDNSDAEPQLAEPAFNLEEEAANNTRGNALCLLQIKDEGKIPQTVVESIVKNTTQIVDNNVELVKSGVENCLSNAGLQMQDIPGLEDIFDPESPVRKPFDGCNNEASQIQYYKRNFNLVVRH
jgi:hypothetical protein